MNRAIRAAALSLGRHLVQVMPPSRADWAAGMKAEIEAIEDPAAALSFAVGCVRTGYARRLQTVSGVLATLRWSIAVVTLLFSVLVLANAWWSTGLTQQGGLPLVFGGLGLAFLGAALTLVRFGPGALAGLAVVMLALNTVGVWATTVGGFLYADVFRALILEGYLLWSMLLFAGLALHHATRSTWLARLARDHGWND